MRQAGRRARRFVVAAALAAMAALAAIGGAAPIAAAPLRPDTGRQATSELRLVGQTPTVAPGGQLDMSLDVSTLPPDGSVELTIHGRIRSRSELTTSIDGTGLRTKIHSITKTIAELPANADGSRLLSVSFDPSVVGGLALSTAGVYPVEVVARAADSTELSTLITHLLLEPGDADESPALAVAVVAEVDAPPAFSPDGGWDLSGRALDGTAELLAALNESPTPATLAVSPETVDALRASADPAHAELLDALRTAGESHPALVRPYVATSPDALIDAGLISELGHQLERGRGVLADALGAAPSEGTWIAGDDLTSQGVAALAFVGFDHVVLTPDQVEPLRPGLVTLSLAQPFLVGTDDSAGLDALVLDPAILDRLDTSAAPALEVNRLLAELAVLWFERPGIARAAVIPVDTDVRPEVVAGLLAGLESGDIFEGVSLDDAFDAASTLLQPGDSPVERDLVASDGHDISPAVARGMDESRALLASFSALMGPDSPRVEPMVLHLLLATSAELSDSDQRAHLEAADAVVPTITSGISAPERETITLTAREGTVPLTLRNDTGVPVNVVVRLRSPKLEFPKGDVLPLVLTEATTRLDIAVRARASGAFPLDVTVTSPDGALTVATIDYSIQSTAVSGAGVVLSAGAALFLMIWWARHWSRARRSAKLVGSDHPSHLAQEEPAGQ